jgi:hypothetical protein
MFWFGVSLYKMPRYKKVQPKTAKYLESYFKWKQKVERGDTTETFKRYAGYDNVPPRELIDFYKPIYYKNDCILCEVAEWEDYEHIRSWFIKNVNKGQVIDGFSKEVTKRKLEQLLGTCKKVLDSCEVVEQEKLLWKKPMRTIIDDRTYTISYSYDSGFDTVKKTKYVLRDTSVAKKLLPLSESWLTSPKYGDSYIKGLEETIKVVEKVLRETDFETEAIYYRG